MKFVYACLLSLAIAHPVIAEPIKLGLVVALSGPIALHGEASRIGLELGLKEGGCEESFQIIVENDEFVPKKSLTAAKKLVEVNRVKLLLGIGSGPSNAIAPYAEKSAIPFLALAGDSSVAINRRYVIRLRPTTGYEGEMVSKLAIDSGNIPVALICNINEFTLGVCDGIVSKLGDQVTLRIDLLPEETDFRTTIAKIRASNAKSIIPILLPGKLGNFAKQTREMNLQLPFLGGVFFESTADVQASAGALFGAKYVIGDASSEFQTKYRDLGRHDASVGWAVIFYDTGRLLCKYGENTPDLLSALKAVQNYQGAVGKIDYRSDHGDSYYYFPFIQKIVTESGFVPLSRDAR